jgi:hypothetical protein|tara:strand:- start:259 stop:396 length:138 start_codon:yes stop_codon:yes gene_type:complete
MSVEKEIFIHVGDGKRATSWLQNLTFLICQERFIWGKGLKVFFVG